MKYSILAGISYGVAMPLIGNVWLDHPAWWVGCAYGFVCSFVEWRRKA